MGGLVTHYTVSYGHGVIGDWHYNGFVKLRVVDSGSGMRPVLFFVYFLESEEHPEPLGYARNHNSVFVHLRPNDFQPIVHLLEHGGVVRVSWNVKNVYPTPVVVTFRMQGSRQPRVVAEYADDAPTASA